MSIPAINYSSRDFKSLRNDLINWAKTYHPDTLQYFNDANPDVIYLEMCAYVGDILSYYTDKTFNETFRTSAQARTSLVRIANDLGFFELGSTPATTQLVFSIVVPYITIEGVNYPDPKYLISLKPETKVKASNGEFFEVLEDINFADPRNRKEIMNLDGNNQLIDYTIEKYVFAKAGQTKIQRYYVDAVHAKPFLNIIIADKNITEITSVVNVIGNEFISPDITEFTDPKKQWYEVRDLSQSKLFLDINPIDETNSTIATGQLVEIPRRYIVRRDENDIVSITFGNNSPAYDTFNKVIQNTIEGEFSLASVVTNTSLGSIPAINSTLFIKYRIGGGESTNAQIGQINNIISKQFYPPTSDVDFTKLQKIRNTLKARNDIPAVGGKDVPTVEEIRALSGKVFAAQERGVTYPDIRALIETMPAKFGRPFRISSEEIKPKVGNYNELKSYLNKQLDILLNQDTQVERNQIVNTIKDYLTTFESTAKDNTAALNNAPSLWLGEKMRLYLLSKDADGSLITIQKQSDSSWVSPQETLKNNIKEFLKNKRIQGDWIDIVDAKIVNFQVEFTILADKNRKQEVLIQCLQTLKDYFNINNWEINQPIFISNVIATLQQITGVISVVSLKFYNIFDKDLNSGKQYQPIEIGRYRNNYAISTGLPNKYEMVSEGNVIKAYPDSIFELKYPDVDLIGNVI